jgi:prepilin-type N-terminal cleavage/methylation domain-containing protein
MKNERGFSLVEIIVVMGMLGVASLGVMQLTKTITKGQGEAIGTADLVDMRKEMAMYLADSKDCSASLNGVTFQGATIKLAPVAGLEIWSADNTGARGTKHFFENQKFGKVKIQEISLKMPDYNSGTNWPTGIDQFFKGELTLKSDKQNMGTLKTNLDQVYQINLKFNTDAGGTSTIQSCSSVSSIKQTREGFCTPALTPDNGNVGTCPAIANYNLRRYSACIPGTQRSITCCYIPTSSDSNGWCSQGIEGHSGCFNGCGASDANYEVQHINGVTSGSNDTHSCCFIPKDSSKTKPFTSGAMRSWDAFNGCNSVTGYDVLKTNAVTGGVGNQSACTYVPKITN